MRHLFRGNGNETVEPTPGQPACDQVGAVDGNAQARLHVSGDQVLFFFSNSAPERGRKVDGWTAESALQCQRAEVIMDKGHQILLVLSLVCLTYTDANLYTAIGGRKLRPFNDYSVAVSWNGEKSTNLLFEILGNHLPGGPFREAQQQTIDPYTTKIITFKIGNIEPGNYTFSVRSTSGKEFGESTSLEYVGKSYCVFLHTDKTVYQPGDTIYFRLLALNMYLKPLFNLNSQLTLKDGKGNIIKRWLNIGLTKGVASGEFQIADFPVLGDWMFEIELNGQMYKKKVLVADFVLPKFLVNIDAPKHIYFNNDKFSVSISAKQLTGQEINGELTLTAYPVYYSGVLQPIFQPPLRKVMNISGFIDVEISIKDELKLREIEGSERTIVVEAAVEEKLTGRRHNVSRLIHLHSTRYSLAFDAPRFYKPDLPYTIQLKASMKENVGEMNFLPATISYNFIGEGEKMDNMVESSCNFDQNGDCQHTFIPASISNQSILNVQISYMDIKREIKGIKSANSPYESYLQIKLLKSNPVVNEKVRFLINATEPLNFFSYYVLGRGDVVYASTEQVVPAKRIEIFEFSATQAMAPESTIIVTYTKNNRELIGAAMKFKVNGLLQNNVYVAIKSDNLEPNGNLDIGISASPNSYVALMAGASSPDFSISTNHHYQAGEGSGLTANMVYDEIRSFGGNRELQHPSTELSVNVTKQLFEKSDVFLLTNNIVNRQYYGTSETENFVEGSTRPPLAGPYAFSHLPAPPAPRLHLGKLPTPTWLFTNITLGGDGRGNLGRRVSENAGPEWSVGAWAVHPTLGLGFAPTVMARMRPQMLSIAAPDFARKGETITVTATFQNVQNSDAIVEIILHNSNQEFKFEQLDDPDAKPRLDLYQKQKLTVKKNHAASAVFFITPTIAPSLTGTTINFEISATTRGVTETKQKQLTLFPDGEELIEQVTELLDLRNGPVKVNLALKEKVTNSRRQPKKVDEEIRAVVTGSLISPVIGLLPKLLELPPASGYHNMLPFMASVLLLQHLEEGDQLPDSVRTNALNVIQKCYQQQMSYRQSDGSFSLSANSKSKGSIWATGMTAMWIARGLKIPEASIQYSVLTDALKWLSEQQLSDGSFRESFSNLDDSIEQKQIVLTALTLHTFIDTKFYLGKEYNNLINKAQDWLARNIATAANEQWDATMLAPLASVLHTAGHPAAIQATNLLNSISNATDGKRWWKLKSEELEMRSPWIKHGSRNIWATSWGLQALLAQGYVTEALETGKTLISLLGDWSDLPQVLTAIPALINLAQSTSRQIQASLEFQCGNERTPFNVNKQNIFIPQKIQIRQKECTVDGEGYGTAVAALQVLKRTNVTGPWPRFTLDPRVDAISTPHKLQLSICLAFVPLPEETNSGPVLLKLRLPTGFVADLDIAALQASGFVRSAREIMSTKRSGEPPLQMVLSPLTRSEKCLTVRASRLYPVANERPGVITLVDLTDNTRRARGFFSGGSLSACELCGGQGNRACGDANIDIQGGCLVPQRQESPPSSLFNDEAVQERSSSYKVLSNSLTTVISLIIPQIIKLLF